MRTVLLTLTALVFAARSFAAVDYGKQIAPLFEEHCTDCHSASDTDGDFALDTFAALIKGGKTGKAIEPGKAQDSLLVKFLEGRSGKSGKNQFMPPGKRDHFTSDQIKLVRQWIDEGASGPSSSAPINPLAKLPKIASKTKTKPVYALAASQKGDVIAIGRFGSVELLDSSTRKTRHTINGIAGKPNAVLFSASGDALFVAAGDAGISGVAYQITVAGGKIARTFTGHTDALYAIAVSPDGKQLATGGYDQKIKLWDLATGRETSTIKGHNGSINALAYRPDGKVLASASSDRTVKLWTPATGTRLDTFSQPLKEQITLLFDREGKTLLAGGADSRIRQWRISDSAKEGSNPLLETKFACDGSVLKLVLSPDGKSFLASSSDRTLKVWNISGLAPQKQLETQSDWAPAVAWLNNKQLVAARFDGTAALYDTATGKPLPLTPPAPKVAEKPKAKAKAELTRLQPQGLQTGVETIITATGKSLSEVTQIKSANTELQFTIIESTDTTVKFKALAPKTVLRGAYDISLINELGTSQTVKLHVDDLPQITSTQGTLDLKSNSYDCWGTLAAVGQRDDYRFKAKAGMDLVLDLAARRIGSTAETIQLELFDASGRRLIVNHGLDSGSDPLIAYKVAQDGEFVARVSETTLEGSAAHTYRLTICNRPYVTGWWPLTIQVGQPAKIELIGYNLHGATVQLTADKPGTIPLPVKPDAYRTRQPLTVLASEMPEIIESEPNDTLQKATLITPPVSINGRLFNPKDQTTADADLVAFEAKQGEEWMIETRASQSMSPADTRIEVLHADGSPVERVKLQAVRSSFNNFRSVDADNPDIRLENYTETGLNEFVYFNGDIMKTFRLPRGPDGGFFFYALNGKRRAYFDTSATAHSLDEPCYIVHPLKPGEPPLPNGLPVLSVNYTNDDDADRKLGRDSRLHFTAPAAQKYLVRVTDSREWSGKRNAYRLVIRKPAPDFTVRLTGENLALPAGGSLGFAVRADRVDDFDADITVKIEGLPAGYLASSPVIIQAGHDLASGSLHATPDAPAMADWSKVKITASAMVGDRTVTHPVNNFGKVTLAPKPKFVALMEPDHQGKPQPRTGMTPQVITVVPGQITKAWIRVERNGDKGIINFDVHGLPHGVIVNDIGLNGVQVREGETEREIEFIAANWVSDQERLVHACVSSARNEADSTALATSFPVLMRVVKSASISQR